MRTLAEGQGGQAGRDVVAGASANADAEVGACPEAAEYPYEGIPGVDRSRTEPFERADRNIDSVWMVAKTAACLLALVPLRLAIIALALALAAVLYMVTRVCVLCEGCDRPRCILVRHAVRVALRGTARFMLVGFGFWPGCIRVRGQAEPSSRCPVIVSNHVSYLEVLFFMTQRSMPAFVMNAHCARQGSNCRGGRRGQPETAAGAGDRLQTSHTLPWLPLRAPQSRDRLLARL